MQTRFFTLLLLIFVTATSPAFADSTLVTHWERSLILPEGWQASPDADGSLSIEPVDPLAYPGLPQVVLLHVDYDFPWIWAPEDAVVAAFDHQTADLTVQYRKYPEASTDEENQEMMGLSMIGVEGLVQPNPDNADSTVQMVVIRLSTDGGESGKFAVLFGDTEEGLMTASEVLGIVATGLILDLDDEDAIRDVHLENARADRA